MICYLNLFQRFVSLILDEMKIKEGLVYNKHSGEMIGFTHLGDINNELVKLEQSNDWSRVMNVPKLQTMFWLSWSVVYSSN